MRGHRQGNTRTPRPPGNTQNWRHPQGASGSQTPHHAFFGEAPNPHFGFRHNRTSSTSSDQSYHRRGNFRSNSSNRNQDDTRNSFFNRQNQRTDHRRATSSENFSSGGYESGHRGIKRPFGFRALENLLEKDPEQLILELSNSKKGLCELIQTSLKDDAIILIVKILKKVADSSFDEAKYKVLQTYLDGEFLSQLIRYISYLPIQNKDTQRRNRYFWDNPDEFWTNVIKISQDIFDSVPTFSRKVLPDIMKSLLRCFPSFEEEHQRHISDEIKENVLRLNEAVQSLVKEYEENKKLDLHKKFERKDEQEPPDDFRLISIYPTSDELVSTIPAFLRPNIVDKPYRDVNHYLDIQFRLLREDFVGPLRSGIASYRSETANKSFGKKRFENVTVHRQIQFLNQETVNEQFCVRVRFDFSKKKKSFKYENSRKFMFGSLLCFTRDNFRTIIFGKVAERKEEDLEKGELIVGFDQNINIEFEKRNYLMVECSVYFEPYYHVLHVLQNMSIENFPMEKYIINVDPSVEPPEYLLAPDCRIMIKGNEFSALINWPNRNFYNFNESQNAAFKAALTQEFSIIQGPPGTGKTYLGLKIAKTLLENQKIWYKKTPMLVICYTNHALDQFLEGLTEFTDKILRVGGQSRNEKLQSFNLRNRGKFKLSAAVLQKRDEVQIILQKIKTISENLKQMEMWHSVRDFQVFEDVTPDFKNSWFYRQKRDEILDWLLGRREHLALPTKIRDPNDMNILRHFDEIQIEDNIEDDLSDDEYEDALFAGDEVQVDDLFEEMKIMAVQCSIPLITLSALQKSIIELEHIVIEMSKIENPTIDDFIREEKCSFELLKLKDRYVYLQEKLVEGRQNKANLTIPRATDLKNPHSMPPNARWDLYFYWLSLYRKKLKEKLELLNKQFREEYKIYEEIRDIDNTNTMKNVLVVGMTTTGAARLRSSLQALKSPVVIVEEAAEVLEAHIITSLTNHCKHLILIGDHQQLKPSTANYSVETFYNLGISLFERMVLNKIQLYTLNVQHRMKPEICSLIAPTIYPALENHPSVNTRLPIRGLDHSLFFIDHTHKEEACEGTSKKNYHEAEFLIHFAKHLVLNGYKPEEITILAAYLGQMFEMQKEKKKHEHILRNVRIAVLDNYQGEECDIILLSLVRSNEDNKIGFLKIENRVCVALSRARDGFYLMGNMTQLCAASELWQKIHCTLQEKSAIGTELALRCQVHPDQITYVKSGEDFLNIPEGGCSQKCGAHLVCGHICASRCHVLNREHIDYKCRETCGKALCEADLRHICKKMCYQECGPCSYLVQRSLPCGHIVNMACHIDVDTYKCEVKVPTTLPCGHEADKPCHCDPATYRCPHPCQVKVEPCGHACKLTCHIRRDPDHLQYKCMKRCARHRKGCTVKSDSHLCPKFCFEECEPCLIPVRKKRTVCSHAFDVPCSSDVDEVFCEKPCTKILSCGHKCKRKCYEPCGRCEVEVEKSVPVCGHTIKIKCCLTPDRSLCNKNCPLKLPCGHPCTKKCNELCTTNCKEIVDCVKKAPCGHTVTRIGCSVANSNGDQKILLKYCNHPCGAKLKCDHTCPGTCGECHQGRIHRRCTNKCGNPLVCNHPCTFPCRLACKPCTRPCPFKCKHSTCSKKCGDVCTPCKERCVRSCQHQRCTKFCSQMCNVRPCNHPCQKKLKCGHVCIGYCGDPCPDKCLVCDKEELTEIFFGFEDDEGARFVLLEDCGHVFESQGLDGWMQRDKDKIGFKECPQCKTPIKTNQRYTDLIKRALKDVAQVKKNLYGTEMEISKKRAQLLTDLRKAKVTTLLWGFPKLVEVLQVLEQRLLPNRRDRRQAINKAELNAIESKLQIIQHIIKICDNRTMLTSDEDLASQVKLLLRILLREQDSTTDQEIEDIQYELNRLSRIFEYAKVKRSPYYNSRYSMDNAVKLKVEEIQTVLLGFQKFNDTNEEKTKTLLKELSVLVSSGIGISEKEKREIVLAMGFKQGHWYKCPNGHPYTIGDCGGAMQEAVCPECKAKIGGTNHRLLGTNSVATEMDGARHGAWSEAANMGNYQL